MIVLIFSRADLPVEPGARGDVDLAAQNRLNSGFPGGAVKVNHSVHDAVIGDCQTVHAQLLRPRHQFLYLGRRVQQAVFCMDV